MARPCTLVEVPVAEHRDLPPREASGRQSTNGIDGLLGRRSTRSILPPLPRRPSLLGRSSSPRYHHNHHSSSSSSATNATGGTTASHAATADRLAPLYPGRRAASPSYWPTHRLDSDLSIPDEWGDDTVFDQLADITDTANSSYEGAHINTEATEATDSEDQYLSAFVNNEFSSPSTYPSFTGLPASRESELAGSPTAAQASTPNLASTAPLRRTSACNINFAPPSRSTTQLTNSTTGESQNSSLLSNDFSFDDFLSESPQSSFSDSMPSTRARTGAARTNTAAAVPRNAVLATKNQVSSRPGTAAHRPMGAMTFPNRPLLHADLDEDDPFKDEEKPASCTKGKPEDLTTIDLTDANAVPEGLLGKEVDNRIKISAFQCAICMDDVTNLTVTHCGHLYCAQCLHTSLHVETTAGKCPMCRTKIDMKPRPGYTTKTKGFWPLELKLMTTTRKGKRKADNMS